MAGFGVGVGGPVVAMTPMRQVAEPMLALARHAQIA